MDHPPRQSNATLFVVELESCFALHSLAHWHWLSDNSVSLSASVMTPLIQPVKVCVER